MLPPPNNNASDTRPAKPKRIRTSIKPAVKRAIVKAIKAGESVRTVAQRFNVKAGTVYSIICTQRKLSVVAIRKGITVKRFAAAAPAQTAPTLSADAEAKLRDIALFCEADKSEALNACVTFYYKHLRDIVTQRIKA